MISADEVKEFLKLSRDTSDSVVEAVRLTGEAGVRRTTGRSFEQASTVSARVFSPESGALVWTDDFQTTTGLVVKTDDDGDGVYETTWAAADYELHPLNNLRDGEWWPYCEIRATGNKAFPTVTGRAGSVQVTARWGWVAIPQDVRWAACIIGASDEKVRDLVAGQGGFTKWSREHADDMLSRFVRAAHGLGVA